MVNFVLILVLMQSWSFENHSFSNRHKSADIIYSIENSDLPKFFYKGEFQDFFIDGKANKNFKYAVDDVMREKRYGIPSRKVEVTVKIDSKGKFVGRVYGLDSGNVEYTMAKDQLIEVLTYHVRYIPAYQNGQNVDFEIPVKIPLN